MLRRLVAAALGVALAAGFAFAIDQVTLLRYGLAVGAGVGTGVFLVVDGSAGAGEGWVYHRVRSREARVLDVVFAGGAGAAIGLGLAWISTVIELGEFGSGVLVVTGALVVANLVFLYRRPKYEAAFENIRND